MREMRSRIRTLRAVPSGPRSGPVSVRWRNGRNGEGSLDETTMGRGTVLLVEDEPIVALLAREILEEHGFQVTVASHGRVALSHARAAPERPHTAAIVLAVVDLGLPDMGGGDVVRELRQITPDLSIIIATGYDTAELESEFGAMTRLVLLSKPYNSAALRDAMRTLGFDIS